MLAGHASSSWLSELGAGMPYNREKNESLACTPQPIHLSIWLLPPLHTHPCHLDFVIRYINVFCTEGKASQLLSSERSDLPMSETRLVPTYLVLSCQAWWGGGHLWWWFSEQLEYRREKKSWTTAEINSSCAHSDCSTLEYLAWQPYWIFV